MTDYRVKTIYMFSNFMKKITSYQFIIFIITVFVVWVLVISIVRQDYVVPRENSFDLRKDGFCVYKNVLDTVAIEAVRRDCTAGDYKDAKRQLLENDSLRHLITDEVGEGYQFQDYIWIIQKSSVHTCHRDNNGDFFNVGQKHPSYTMLIYIEKMEKCLGVIPQSHLDEAANSTNLLGDSLVNLVCDPGDVILFNANLIHVGSLNQRDDNLRIQMKVSHVDDLDVLSYYENFNKVLNRENTIPRPLLHIQRNLSCMFPAVSDLTQTDNIQSARGSDNGAYIGPFQKMFSYLFYGNKDFYDLPNAF